MDFSQAFAKFKFHDPYMIKVFNKTMNNQIMEYARADMQERYKYKNIRFYSSYREILAQLEKLRYIFETMHIGFKPSSLSLIYHNFTFKNMHGRKESAFDKFCIKNKDLIERVRENNENSIIWVWHTKILFYDQYKSGHFNQRKRCHRRRNKYRN
jgi:hypothetical protein